MAISDRNYDMRLSFDNKINPLVILLAINMIFFVTLYFLKSITYIRLPEGADVNSFFEKNILSWFALSANTNSIVTKIWTFVTHAFVHIGFWQLFANMIWLWVFGYILINLTGARKIVPIYLYGAMAGAVVFIIALIINPHIQNINTYYYGAGAAVMATCTAATTISAQYKLFPMLSGGISLWIIALLYAVIDFSTLPPNYPLLYITHLAGALGGFLFIFLLRRGFDGSDWMNHFYDWVMNLFNPDKPKKNKNHFVSTLFYKAANKPPFKKTPHFTQEKLDDILDKINQKGGYNNLTEEEKEFLKKVSQEGL